MQFILTKIGENIQTMRLLFEVFMIVILIILVSICYASIVSAAYDDPEEVVVQTNQQQHEQQQQQLPYCDEDHIQQTNRNAGYLYFNGTFLLIYFKRTVLLTHSFHSVSFRLILCVLDCCMFQHWTVKYPHWIFWMKDKKSGQLIRHQAQ